MSVTSATDQATGPGIARVTLDVGTVDGVLHHLEEGNQ